MSYFADNGSVRAVTKLFENVHVPMLFTHVQSPPELAVDSNIKESENNAEHVVDYTDKMIKDVEEVTVDGVNNFLDNENPNMVPDETNLYKHLKEYPIVNSWVKIFHWFPLPRIVRPALMRVAYSDTLSPYTITVDNFLVSGLNSLDAAAPGIRTLRLRDIRNVILDTPIKNIASTTTQSINQFGSLSQKILITPSRNGIHQMRILRGQYLPIAGSEPLIRSQINPIIKQVNENLASNINSYLPPKDNDANKEVSINYVYSDTNANEVNQTVQLISVAVSRLRPLLLERLEQLNKLPENSAKYVAAIYQDSKTNRGDGRMVIILASLETIRKLSIEGWNFVSSSGFTDFIKSKPTSDEKLSIVEEEKEVLVLEPTQQSDVK